MKHCPNNDCRHAARVGRPAEFEDHVATCSDCGATLALGPVLIKSTVAPNPTRELWRRLAVTAAVPLVVLATDFARIPVPQDSYFPRVSLGVFDLGLAPVILAFVLVEIVALAIPRLRPLRIGGTASRARLARWSLMVAFVLAGLQAFSLTYGAGIFGLRNHLALGAAMIAGTAMLTLIAGLVSRFGLGNGFSVVLGAGILVDLGTHVTHFVRDVRHESILPMSAGIVFMVVAAGCGAMSWFLRRSTRTRTAGPLTLRLPLCGIAPLLDATALTLLIATLGNFGLDVSRIAALLTPGSSIYFWILATLILLLGPAYSLLFHQIRNVTRVGRQLNQISDEARFTQALRALRRRGVIVSCGILVAFLGATQMLVGQFAIPVHGLFEIGIVIILPSITLDLIDEWKARRMLGALAPAWPEQRLYAVDPIVRSLHEAGIPAFPRGVFHRTLLQFFGPFVSVDILVPQIDLPRAKMHVEERLESFSKPKPA